MVENLHAFEHRTPKPGEFADDQGVAFAKFVQNVCNPAFAPCNLAGSFLLDEFHASEILPVGKGEDIGPVLLLILAFSGDAKVSDGSGFVFGHHLPAFEENVNSLNKQHPMGWFNFDFSQSVMDAVQDLRSPGEPDRVPSNQRLQDNTGVLPPKSALRIIPENWEPPNR